MPATLVDLARRGAAVPAAPFLEQPGGRGLAYLRFDRAAGELTAGSAKIRLIAASG